MLSLFPDEQIVSQSPEGSVTLTTHRIHYECKDWGRSYNQSIMLEHITSCENYFNSKVWLLFLSGLSLVCGIVSRSNGVTEAVGPWIIIALIFGLIYWLTRRNYITIASPSTKMQINVNGMKKEHVLEFIDKVEHTKHKRILALNNRIDTVV